MRITTLRRRQFIKLALASGLMLASRSHAQAQSDATVAGLPAPTPAERDAMAELANAFMHKYDVPALSFAIGYGGAILHQDAFGVADRERNEAVTPMHLFRIASVSKIVTSSTVFTLIEQGRIKLTDRIFGPGGVLGTEFGAPPYNPGVDQITLEQLLTHTSGGWPNDSRDPMFAHPTMDHAELIRWTLKNQPLDNPPGTHYAYSNFGYCIVGRLIEKLTGQRYADHARSAMLARCGVNDMTIAGNTLAQRQRGEVRYYGQGDNPYDMNVTRMDSHGGWIARPADLVQVLMHVTGLATPAILQPSTIDVMTTGSAVNPGYAKGWVINRFGNWWHNGSLPGTSTIAVRTRGGFCWAAFINTRRSNSGLDGDLDALNWNMFRKVASWRVR